MLFTHDRALKFGEWGSSSESAAAWKGLPGTLDQVLCLLRDRASSLMVLSVLIWCSFSRSASDSLSERSRASEFSRPALDASTSSKVFSIIGVAPALLYKAFCCVLLRVRWVCAVAYVSSRVAVGRAAADAFDGRRFEEDMRRAKLPRRSWWWPSCTGSWSVIFERGRKAVPPSCAPLVSAVRS